MATKVRKTDRKMDDKERNLKMLDLIKSGLSYTEVGKMLGMTKNAVSGMVYRIKNRGWISKPKKLNPNKPKATKMKNIVSLDMPETPLGLTIFELKENTCRYMIGNHKYCGCTSFKRSYCVTHYLACHNPDSIKKRKA